MFNKVLVAHYSPANGCRVQEGQILVPNRPRLAQVRHGTQLGLVSAADLRTRSKFGWVKTVSAPFTAEAFARDVKYPEDGESLALLVQMFASIEHVDDGTPISATFFERGVEGRQVVLEFHKVILHGIAAKPS